MPRLRRSDPGAPGLTRRRRGKGFVLLDAQGERISDADIARRVKALAIPPAWTDVWICPDDRGHVQATGTDAAGRRQYRYHPEWHMQRARRKFDDMLVFARVLPVLRARLDEDLRADGLDAAKGLALCVRMLDRGFFRIGSEDYAEKNGTYGLATMRKEHVTVLDGAVVFDYPAKHGLQRVQHVVDPVCAELVQTLKRRRGGGDELFAYKEGGRWCDVRSTHINSYIKDRTGLDVSAKDFRTWNATVLAAIALGVSSPPTKTAAKRAEVRAVKEVATYLGNTPAVARSSYIDPRVFDRFRDGLTIGEALAVTSVQEGEDPDDPVDGPYGPGVEAAVVDLIDDEVGAPAMAEELVAAA